jgi:hypothetical protein
MRSLWVTNFLIILFNLLLLEFSKGKLLIRNEYTIISIIGKKAIEKYN